MWMNTLAGMYVTLVPTICAGIFNMIWCKSGCLSAWAKPLDGGRLFRDGKRIFGDNKTWKGLLGYLVLNALFMVLWGPACRSLGIEHANFFYTHHANVFSFNLGVGLLLGLAYALFELPNSFLKRRIAIEPGKTASGARKIAFVFLDQADSIFGCALVVWLFYPLGLPLYLLYVLVGAFTHILLNLALYLCGLRKNPI